MTPAFVIGNGTSRKPIDCGQLRSIGTVYACNAAYRDFDPDYLICVDAKMCNEIAQNNYQHKCSVWTYPREQTKHLKGFNVFNSDLGWSSGPTALKMACSNEHKKIYVLGFDYSGNQGMINNLYAGTNNYRSIGSRATYYGNWLKQTLRVVSEYHWVNFVRVIDENCLVPDQLAESSNLKHIDVKEFRQLTKT